MSSATGSENVEDAVTEIDISEFTLFSGKLAELISKVPKELLEMSESDLAERFDYNSTDWLLRRRFWELINKAKKNKITSIPAAAIYEGICSRQNWDRQYLDEEKIFKLAMLLKPIRDYLELCDHVFNSSMAKMLQFIEKTKISDTNVARFLKLAEFAANRKYGPVIQRMQIHQRTEHLSAADQKDVTPEISAQNVSEQIANISTKLIGSNDETED